MAAGTSRPVSRWLRHVFSDVADTRRLLDEAALQRLTDQVARSEQRHSGEIRLCIEAGLSLADLWRGVSPRQRALTVFSELAVWDTEANNGVLIYLLLADHAIEIVADRGLNSCVSAEVWTSLVTSLRTGLARGQAEQGLSAAVEAVSQLLVQHFALQPGQADGNELPDRPSLR